MIKFVAPMLPATTMPSMRLVLAAAPSWRLADGPWVAQAGKAMTSGAEAARKRIAPTGAPAYAHVVCTAQHTIQVMEENSASLAATAESLGNGITFGTQVQTQLSVDVTRVDGRAGSPPRGEPV